MNNESLKDFLIDDFDVQVKYIDGIIEQVNNLSEELKKEFFIFIEERIESNIKINNYSLKDVKTKFEFNEIGAFLALNWIEKDQKTALFCLGYGI